MPESSQAVCALACASRSSRARRSFSSFSSSDSSFSAAAICFSIFFWAVALALRFASSSLKRAEASAA